MSTEDNKKNTTKDELLSQLHEQYAVNNNANLSSMVTLIVGVIAVIGYYGYVFVHTVEDFGCGNELFMQGEHFTMTTLLLTYLSATCILAILMRLCIYQGIAQRKEQIIIENIRKHYDTSNDFKNIFPDAVQYRLHYRCACGKILAYAAFGLHPYPKICQRCYAGAGYGVSPQGEKNQRTDVPGGQLFL